MAVKQGTTGYPSDRYQTYEWAALANGDTGNWLKAGDLVDLAVQVKGTFGTGGTVVLQGSLDGGVTAATLTDPQGNALSFTAAGLKAVLENAPYLRPSVTAGDGSTAITVIVGGAVL